MATASSNTTPWLVRYLRCLHLMLHLVRIGAGAALVYPMIDEAKQRRLKQRWSRRILDILNIRMEIVAEAPAPTGCLIVANHISWLDIFAINAFRPAAFISKSEVRHWPFIGWLSARNDTIFLHRGSRGHAREINELIDARLNKGQDIALFPEGMTTDGSHLRPFHAALLQPAVETAKPLLPLALSYHDPDGEPSLAPAYAGDTTLIQCFSAILACRSLTVRITATPLIESTGKNRRELAQLARTAIARPLGYQERTSSGEHGT